MSPPILALVPLVLLAFWAWMYLDMAGNEALPPCYISVTGGNDRRLDWNVAFIFLNIVTAFVYYMNEYRWRH